MAEITYDKVDKIYPDGTQAVHDLNLEIKDGDGQVRRINAATKIWAAGVQANPLGHMLGDPGQGPKATLADDPVLDLLGTPSRLPLGRVLRRPSQFRPQPPDPLTSEAYARDYDEVKALGAVLYLLLTGRWALEP